ncbi:transcriptional regulator, TetR family [Caldimonas brevitalea]|uniref:Transcriptional regulator, TetR family n=1 Tax=Caldimonas brevitalea TaxID=413882 RepID=A0A0G3BDG5_9BURK|nr:transcriptional regulator, TetR family [Caldimonas brevitalea]
MRRQRLVEAGVSVFGARGYHAATVREVCAVAHLTERYFYESFEGMDRLFAAVYAEVLGDLKRRTVAAIARHAADAPLQATDAALRLFFEYIREDPRRARIVLLDALSINEAVLQQCAAALQDYAGLVGHLVQHSEVATSDSHLDAGLLAAGLVGFHVHVATTWLLGGCETPLDTVVETARFAYRGLVRRPGGDLSATLHGWLSEHDRRE